jgi:hypothetical protein
MNPVSSMASSNSRRRVGLYQPTRREQILTPVYHRLRDGTLYQVLGPNHYRRASPEAQAIHLDRQLGLHLRTLICRSQYGFCLVAALFGASFVNMPLPQVRAMLSSPPDHNEIRTELWQSDRCMVYWQIFAGGRRT